MLWLLFLTGAVLLFLLRGQRKIAAVLPKLGTPVPTLLAWRRASGTRRGLSIQVTDRAVAHRALVQHNAAFLDRPTGAVPSTILTRNQHHNILSAPYGPYWRAVRRNAAAGVLHPSRLRLLADTRARVLANLVRALRSGAPAGESLHFAVYSILVELCFDEDVVSELGEARVRAMQRFQREILLELRSFGVLVRYPRIGKLLHPLRWRKLVSLRRHQEESFLPLVAEVRKRKGNRNNTTTLFINEEDGGSGAVTEGELVSLISEFLDAGTESMAAALEWTMANLVKHPDLQRKLRSEVIVATNQPVEETDLPRLPYFWAVVLESLRRHPPVPFVLRHAEGPDAAEALGLPRLPDGGATVNFLVGKIGRDPAAWSDPMSFQQGDAHGGGRMSM